MCKYRLTRLTKLVLTIAVIGKGQQQASAQVQQSQFNDLVWFSNKPNSKTSVHVEPQEIRQKSNEQPYQPIIFPNSEEDRDTIDKFPPPNQNANSILQSVEQRLPAPSSTVELMRPTRVAIAPIVATASSVAPAHRYSDDQLEYIRDFAWTMFQVVFTILLLKKSCYNSKVFSGIKTSIVDRKLSAVSNSASITIVIAQKCGGWSH